MQVASAIADNTAELCEHCGLTTNHITDGAFQCFVQNAHEVTFRARLHSSPTSTPMELINHIIYWIENGASIAINGILLSVDQSCDIVIESFSEPECQREQQLITEYIETTSMPITEDGSATTGMSSSTTASFVDKTVSFTETPTVPTGRLVLGGGGGGVRFCGQVYLIYLIPYISVAIQKLLDIIYGNLHFISLS